MLTRATPGRFAVERQPGGNQSTNETTDYSARVTDSDRRRLNAAQPGAVDGYLELLRQGQRTVADAGARAKAAEPGAATRRVRVPTVALHTEYDPVAIVANETVYQAAVAAAGEDRSRLLRVYVTSPLPLPPSPSIGGRTAEYGVGHCSFTSQSVLGALAVVNDQVRDGIYPSIANTARLSGWCSLIACRGPG